MRQAVLLDVDGTLVDSNDAHASAWQQVLSEFGYDVPFDRIRFLIGKGGDKLLAETVGVDDESEKGKAISERRVEVFREGYLPELKPFPAARTLVHALRARRLEIVVASSARKEEIDALLDVAHVRDLVHDVKSSSDAEDSKPDPDIVIAALKAARCAPSNAVMLGDTPYDIEAARKARIDTIALRCGGWDDASLRGAVAIYDDPADLLDKLEDSPFMR
jgi:HAD superfamily hydrolase (TIGR01509 family)